MNINKMKTIFKIAHEAKAAVKMVGKHGIGKSVIVNQFGEENGFHVEVLQLPLMEEGDMIGIPVIEDTPNGKVTTWAKPIWLSRIDKATAAGIPSIVFLDELGRASVGIRQVALQMVLEHRLQEHSLGEVNGLPTLMVVADNPADEYDTAEADAALESRFMSFDVEAGLDDFLKYARNVDVLPVITDYLAEHTEKLHFQPDSEGDKGSDPRSWEKLSDILKKTPKGEGLEYSIINSKIGKTVGANFYHFFNNYINVVKVGDVMAIIGDLKKSTEKEQRSAAKKLSKLTKKIEVISAQELANKMLKDCLKESNNVTAEDVVVYLSSLNLENTAGILKNWKNSDDKKESEFYYKDFQKATENRWLLKELIAQVKN